MVWLLWTTVKIWHSYLLLQHKGMFAAICRSSFLDQARHLFYKFKSGGLTAYSATSVGASSIINSNQQVSIFLITSLSGLSFIEFYKLSTLSKCGRIYEFCPHSNCCEVNNSILWHSLNFCFWCPGNNQVRHTSCCDLDLLIFLNLV